MLGKESINQYKNQFANLAVVIFMVIVSINIYKGHARNIVSLTMLSDSSAKQNTILEKIKQSEQRMKSLKSFINNKDISSVLTTIGRIASETDTKIGFLRPGAPVEKPLYDKYPFEFSLKAKSYHAIGKFISRLESSPDIFIIDALSIMVRNTASAYDEEGHISATIRISTVIFRDK